MVSFFSVITYLCVLVVATLFVETHPKVGWDMLGYVGVIESWQTTDSKLIQDEAYSSIRGIREYDELTGQGACQPAEYRAYRADVAHNSVHFAQQLPILAIKPLYVIFISILHRIGFSYIRSFAVISAIAYLGLGVVTWYWLARYWGEWKATVLSSLLILNPDTMSLLRSTSPDGITLLFVVFGLYMLLEHATTILGPGSLLLSIWVRPDALILVGLLLLTFLLLRILPSVELSDPIFRPDWKLLGIRIAENWEWVLLCILALSSYFAIERFAQFYSWGTLFYHSFVGYLVAPAETIVRISPKMYFRTVAINSRSLLSTTELAMLLLLGFLAVQLQKQRNYRYVTACVILSVFVHFLFFPTDSARFHAAAATFIPISLLIACAQCITPTEPATES